MTMSMSTPRNPDIEPLCDDDSPWPYEAYEFVLEAVDRAGQELNDSTELPLMNPNQEVHLTGRQIALAARTLAREQFGLMASTVFEAWSVTSTTDIGTIVFRLIGAGLLSQQENDRLEDFQDIYAIPSDLIQGYAITIPNDTESWGE
jgi:uncharacterized repeat protein (TIGR04138 family)